MALVFTDGFDHYTTITQKWDTGSGGSFVTGRTGNAYNMTNGGDTKKNLPAAATYIFGAAFNGAAPSFQSQHMTAADANSIQACLKINPDGSITAFRNNNVPLGTSAPALITFNQWNYLEWLITVNNGAGVSTIRLNGQQILNLTAQNTQGSSSTNITQFLFSQSYKPIVDDVYMCDTTTAFNNTFLGDTRVWTTYPGGVGTFGGGFAQWTKGGSTINANNYQQVNEHPPDDETTYNTDGNVNDRDSFKITAIPPATGTVFGLAVNLRCEKDDGNTRTMRSSATGQTGPTDAFSAAFSVPGVAPNSYSAMFPQGIYQVDPGTGVAWTIAGVNACEVGYQVVS